MKIDTLIRLLQEKEKSRPDAEVVVRNASGKYVSFSDINYIGTSELERSDSVLDQEGNRVIGKVISIE